MKDKTPFHRAVRILGGQSATADVLIVSPGYVWQILNDRRPLAPEHCPVLERATREKGEAVTCESLLPDVLWHRDKEGNVYIRMTA